MKKCKTTDRDFAYGYTSGMAEYGFTMLKEAQTIEEAIATALTEDPEMNPICIAELTTFTVPKAKELIGVWDGRFSWCEEERIGKYIKVFSGCEIVIIRNWQYYLKKDGRWEVVSEAEAWSDRRAE